MTIPTDPLEAALRAVPQKCPSCDFVFSARIVLHVCPFPGLAPDYPALATAAREWMRQRIPKHCLAGFAYDNALSDVERALGL